MTIIESEYTAPQSLSQLLEAIQVRTGEVKFVAGCTNVLPDLRAREVSPELLVDLTGIKELTHIREEKGLVSIGALTTMKKLSSSELIQREVPILASAARQLGNPLTRNRATVGGNLADASPAADTAPPFLALEATIHTVRPGGKRREIPMDDFFVGPRKSVLEKDEIIVQITFPKPKDSSAGSHIKFGLRNAMAISVVSIALMLEMDNKLCRKARIALGSVAPKPIRAYGAEEFLKGKVIIDAVLEECTTAVQKDISPISDVRASAEYRRALTAVLLKRALREALSREMHR